VTIELIFKQNTGYFLGFSNVRNIIFVQNSSIQVTEEALYLFRKQPILEAGGHSTLFSRENSVSLLKEYCLPLRNFKCEEHNLCAK
jgi:hypothetical protein